MPDPSPRTKLTLRLDRDLIEAAKRYADEQGTSLSRLVAGYFRALARQTEAERQPQAEEDWKDRLSPWTRSLLGRKPAVDLDEEDYYRYLEEKHR
ncbi:hypothetical protein AWN76_007940 [Rhodothermaceae bacterium RA]|nr:hypothetical protein AWN76_007940 [Rhodothermaceae bacterium RA]